MRDTTCFSGLRPGLVGLALVVVLLLLAVPAFAAPQTHTNSIGMEFVLIPAGTFEMGCSSDSEECDDGEKPRHKVRLSKPFYLGKYEVTQRQWEAVMGNNPSAYKGPDRPVENVSWNDVQEFVKRLNAKEGHTRYRLPTEAEWEYAARAGRTTTYSFGNDEGQLGHYAWYYDNSGYETHPVGQKRPNAWGLYDMHGNVWEWVEDWGGDYSGGAVTDPQEPNTVWEGPNTIRFHVLRGCSCSNLAWNCRSAYRGWYRVGTSTTDGGFRLALSPGH